MPPRELRTEDSDVGDPPLDPPVGRRDGGRKPALVECLVDGRAYAVGRDEGEQLCRSEVGMGYEMAPENGKSAPASSITVAI